MNLQPEDPELTRSRVPTAQWWLAVIAMLLPGMLPFGWGYFLKAFGIRLSLTWGVLGAFLLFVLACSIFAAWLLTTDSSPARRPFRLAEAALVLSLLQILIIPVLGILIFIFREH